MSQEKEQHPIQTSDWWKVYGSPKVQPGSVSVDELTEWFSSKTPGKDFLIVDVRRSDCETIIPTAINLPSHTFPATLGTLLPMLIGVPKIVFHCNSSKGRGTRTAGWLADALAEYHTKHSPDGDLSREQAESRAADQAVILTGGINAWTEKHGSTSLDQRGKPWDGKSLATIHV